MSVLLANMNVRPDAMNVYTASMIVRPATMNVRPDAMNVYTATMNVHLAPMNEKNGHIPGHLAKFTGVPAFVLGSASRKHRGRYCNMNAVGPRQGKKTCGIGGKRLAQRAQRRPDVFGAPELENTLEPPAELSGFWERRRLPRSRTSRIVRRRSFFVLVMFHAPNTSAPRPARRRSSSHGAGTWEESSMESSLPCLG